MSCTWCGNSVGKEIEGMRYQVVDKSYKYLESRKLPLTWEFKYKRIMYLGCMWVCDVHAGLQSGSEAAQCTWFILSNQSTCLDI